MDSSDDGERRHDPAAAVELIKQARRGARELTPLELAEHLAQSWSLGRPEPTRGHRGIDLLHETIAYLQSNGQPVPLELKQMRDNGARLVVEREATRKRAPGAGRPTTRTQYDEHADRWRGVRHELARQLWAVLIVPIACELQSQGVPPKGRGGMVARIGEQLSKIATARAIQGKSFVAPPHRTTIKRILEDHGF